ncbi:MULTISPECIES: SAF domain-containing protein [Gordonia]|uniref:SAF domain-containing protein n=1 Tax=Gordonia TaxID=2053 RepID=UPI0012BB2C70|nr:MULTISPECIES: SAF domain-containing protein [Gordonia]MDH3009472.1 SAF domain-containing protein [Gordonia alkanivorans]MDH3027143.1 SAF domain-containing protein [Gordonia alkanivorans]MDH3052545.1 SAF domain-containing protein [Gordonia alkanivorans]QGP87378.1 flagellar biosynthesis protein FlgA [Gordonia sp. 135]
MPLTRISLSRDRLGPRLRDRCAQAIRPGWTRGLAVRRLVAAALIVAAGVIGLAGMRADGEFEVLVAARELLPGHMVDAGDLAPRLVTGSTVPEGAITEPALATGRTVTGRVRTGEILTDTRLLSSRLPAELTGVDDARLVPVRLSDEAVTSLLRPGDVVDVLTDSADVLARRAVVAMHTGQSAAGGISSGRNTAAPVLLAMNAAAAHRVAAAGLDSSLAVVLH